MGDQGIWRSSAPNANSAPVGLASVHRAASRRALHRASAFARFFSGKVSPDCVGAMADQPRVSRAFLDRRAQLAFDAEQSEILDSRLNKLCTDFGYDAEPRRAALAAGRSVAFIRIRNGRRELVHRINPEEFLG
jgi:hypothetical protein